MKITPILSGMVPTVPVGKLSDTQVRVIGVALASMAKGEPDMPVTANRKIGYALVARGLAFGKDGVFYMAGHFGRAPNYRAALWARERTTRSINKLRAMRGQEVS